MNIKELSELRPITRVLVTGGAGVVGSEVLKELYRHRKWYQVKVLDQNTPEVLRTLKPYRKDFQLILGDIRDPLVVDKATHDIDFIIHLAAVVPPVADRKTELAQEVNVNGTALLIQAAEKNSPSAFFLFASSQSVYGDRSYNPWINAEDPLLPCEGDELAQTKARAEHVVKRSRLRWSVFRLSVILGSRKTLNPVLYRFKPDTYLETTTARDAGFALIEAIYHQDDIKGKTFNLSGGEHCRVLFKELLTIVYGVTDIDKLHLPDEANRVKKINGGNYADANQLEKILHFQQDTIHDYYEMLKDPVPGLFGKIRMLLGRTKKENTFIAGVTG